MRLSRCFKRRVLRAGQCRFSLKPLPPATVALRFEATSSSFPTLLSDLHASLLNQTDIKVISSSYLTVDVVVAAEQADAVIDAIQPTLNAYTERMPRPCRRTTWLANGALACDVAHVGTPCNCEPASVHPELEPFDIVGLLLRPSNTSACEELQNMSITNYVMDVAGSEFEILGSDDPDATDSYLMNFKDAQEVVDRVESSVSEGPCVITYVGMDAIECFPPTAAITMADGSFKTMEQIAVGDMVVCYQDDGSTRPCAVTLLGHKGATSPTTMVVIRYQAGSQAKSIAMTAAHFVFKASTPVVGCVSLDASTDGSYVAARTITPGDWLLHYNTTGRCHTTVKVVGVGEQVYPGFYNPAVETGSYVVDGVRVSVYFDLVPHVVWQALARPLVAEVKEAERGIPAKNLPDGVVPEFEAMHQVLGAMMRQDAVATQAALQALVVEVAGGEEYTLEETQQRLGVLFLTFLSG